ncbi:MAG: PilW family protein [Burkholderiaceae bacterium]
MKDEHVSVQGFSLVELMIAMTIGLFLVGAVISVYLAQVRSVKSSTSQASIQNAENAIAALVTPVVRSTGYAGCATLAKATSNLVPGGPPPLGTLAASPGFLIGYEAANTGVGARFTVTQTNTANSLSAADWTPGLEPTLLGATQQGSDVLIVLGPVPGASPVNVTSMLDGSNSFVVNDATGLTADQYGVVSTCADAIVFKITDVTSTTVSHLASAGAMNNLSDSLQNLHFLDGTHILPLQQTAFYVARGQGDQSVLMRATYDGTVWVEQPLVPGVDSMQVQYAVRVSDTRAQYVTADAVTDWTKVFAVKLGFLVQGQLGSGGATGGGDQSFPVLGTVITVPADGRLRHVFEMTINLRNT